MRWLSLLLCLLGLDASAATYYISNSVGSNAFAGTLADPAGGNGPKQTLAAAQTLIQAAAAGDQVLFRRGDTWTGTAPGLSLTKQGVAGNPIVIGAYGSGPRPTFDLSSTNQSAILTLNPTTAYLTFDNLHLTTTAAHGSRPYGVKSNPVGAQVSVNHDVVFSNCEVNNTQYGFSLYTLASTIDACLIHDNYKDTAAGESGPSQGIWTHGTTLSIRNSTIYGNGRPSAVGGEAGFDHNLYLGCDGCVVEGNTIGPGVDGIKLRRAQNNVVKGNLFTGLEVYGITLGGDIEGGAANNVIERNIFTASTTAIHLTNQSGTCAPPCSDTGVVGLIIRNNLFHTPVNAIPATWTGNGQLGYLTVGNYQTSDVQILGNVFYGMVSRTPAASTPDRAAIYVANLSIQPVNLKIKDNIFHRSTNTQALVRIENGSGFGDLDYNLYGCTNSCNFVRVAGASYASLAAFRAAWPAQEVHGLAGNPLWVNPTADFHLTASSPAISAGLATPALSNDYDGLGRPQGAGVDVGAFEYVAAPPVLAPPVLLP